MKIGERIRKKRIELGLSQEELALKMGYKGRSSVSMIEAADELTLSKVQKVATALNISPVYLMGWQDEPTIPQADNILPIGKKRFPLLGEIACGTPIFIAEDRESYVVSGTDIKADFCLIAKGDSMIGARIHDGDIVFIRDEKDIIDGQIYAVSIDDEATLKRVYYDKTSSTVQLIAENPKYRPLVYRNEDLEHIHILGKAVAFQSDVI